VESTGGPGVAPGPILRRMGTDVGTWAIAALGLLTLAFFAWLAAGGGGSTYHSLVTDVIFLPFGLVASLLAFRTAWRETGARRRAAWCTLGSAFVAFWIGDILWFLSEATGAFASSGSWADAAYLAYYPLLLVGLLLLVSRNHDRLGRLRSALDVGVIFLGGGLLIWYSVLLPTLEGAGSDLGDIIAVAYPVGDLLLLLGAAFLLVRHDRAGNRRVLVALMAALGLGFASDLVYGSLAVQNAYESGGLLDGGYLLSWVLFALAAFLESRGDRSRGTVEDVRPEKVGSGGLLGAVSIVVGLAALFYALRGEFGTAHGAAALAAVVVTVLAMGRQLLAQKESSRLREERVVRLGEARFQKALRRTQFSIDHADDSVVWLDSRGRVLEVNASACRRLGYSREEFLGLTVFEIDETSAIDPGWWDGYWSRLKERGSLTLERDQRCSDGRIFPAEITANYMEYEGEEYSCSFMRDISERRQAERTLRESEERLLRAQAVAHVGNWELDMATDSMWGSPEAFKIYGLERTSPTLPFKVVKDVPLAEERPRLEAALRGLMDGHDYSMEYRIRRANDGEIRTVRSSAELVRDVSGGVVKVVGVIQDMTDLRLAEKLLRQTQFSVDQASDLVFWLDPDGSIVYVSESAGRRLGYSREELLRMTVFDVAVGLRSEEWPQRWGEIKKGRILAFEREFRTREGELFPVEISANFFDYEGQEYNCAFVRDVGERKRAEKALAEVEAQLRQSQKMEAIGQMAGGIAHDFNNLLTAISGYSDLILDSTDDAVEVFRDDLNEIKAAAGRATALTRQILAFSRRQALQPEVMSLNEVVAGAERLLKRTLGENIELLAFLDPDLGLTEVDGNQMGQVLMNLALNARDAMSNGGRLTLETGNVELGAAYCRTQPDIAPGPYVMCAVSDTGSGMDEETRSRVFEPFFTTKEPGKGTGLGLATVYGTIKQSGGSVTVYSECGVGTTFRIYLPRVDRPAEERRGKKTVTVDLRGRETVLVVEDESGVRALVSRVLTNLGYKVLDAESGDRAFELLKECGHDIDLLLTDVVLAGSLQGHELAQAALGLYAEMPVLYMSGYTRDAIVHSGRLEPGINYIEKPFSPENLGEKVRQVLDSVAAPH